MIGNWVRQWECLSRHSGFQSVLCKFFCLFGFWFSMCVVFFLVFCFLFCWGDVFCCFWWGDKFGCFLVFLGRVFFFVYIYPDQHPFWDITTFYRIATSLGFPRLLAKNVRLCGPLLFSFSSQRFTIRRFLFSSNREESWLATLGLYRQGGWGLGVGGDF